LHWSSLPAILTGLPRQIRRRSVVRRHSHQTESEPGPADGRACRRGAASTAADLSGVTLKIGTFPAVGWDVEIKAAGLAHTPYKVDYVTEDSGSLQLQGIASGRLDVASSSSIPPIFAYGTTNKGNFTAISAGEANTLYQDTIVGPGSKITSVAQLKGKKVGYVPNTTAEYFLLVQLQNAGLTFKDITPVQLTTSEGLSALLGGSIAAFADYGTTVIAGEAHGAKVIADGGPILAKQTGGLVSAVEIATPDLKDPAKAAAVADYVARINGAYVWAHKNPAAWSKIYAANTNESYSAAYSAFEAGEKEKATTLGPVVPQAVAAEQAISDVFFKASIIPSDVNVSQFWSTALNSQLTADEAKYQG
jgi:sulfonate transport system substrate-binding protein